jgi:DNA-binding NtrC family response regulator
MPINIIYLEDEPILCELFAEYFESENVIIKTYCEVQEAIEAVKKNPPDLFFIDYRLPGFTGDQVALQLDPQIPKYLITGDINIQTKYPFIKIVQKPYSRVEIEDILNEALKKSDHKKTA